MEENSYTVWKQIEGENIRRNKRPYNKSENDPKTCKFYEDLEEILSKKLCVKPIVVASNKKIINSEEIILKK